MDLTVVGSPDWLKSNGGGMAGRGVGAAGSYIGSSAASTTFAAVFRQGLSEADFSRADVACSAPFRRGTRSVMRGARRRARSQGKDSAPNAPQ
jgi:phosphoribulokinase